MNVVSQDTYIEGGDSLVILNSNQMTLEVLYSEKYNCAMFKGVDFECNHLEFILYPSTY